VQDVIWYRVDDWWRALQTCESMKKGEDHKIKVTFSELPSLKRNDIFQNHHLSDINSFSARMPDAYELINLQRVLQT